MEVLNCTAYCQLLSASPFNVTQGYMKGDKEMPVATYHEHCSNNCSGLLHQYLSEDIQFNLPESVTSDPTMRRPRKPAKLPQPPLYILICVSLLYIIIFIIGTLGNLLVVLVVCRTREMRNTTNFFLVNLSVADLLVILVCMPSAFVDIFSKEIWYLGPVMCK